MTTPTVRALPRVVFPGDGEPFASWMLRLAARLDLDPSTLQTRTGLVDERRGTVDAPVGYGITLTDQQRTNLAFAARTPVEKVDATLLSWFDGGPIDLSGLSDEDGASLRKVALFQWAYFSSSNACGDCLQENGWRWSLAWRLPWSYACTRHGRFLASTCPRCDQPFMLTRRDRIFGPPLGSRVPEPDQCNNPQARGVAVRSRTAVACGHPLHDLPTPTVVNQALLDAQAALTQHLNRKDRPVEWWGDLRAVASLLMRFMDLPAIDAALPGLPDPVRAAVDEHWTTISDQFAAREMLSDHRRGPRTRTHTDTPTDPLLFAPYAALALSTVTEVHDRASGGPDTLRAVYEASRQQTRATLPSLLRQRGASAELVNVAVTTFSTRNAILARAPGNTCPRRAADDHPVLPRHIPWLWWPARYAEITDLFPDEVSPDAARAYLSLAAAKVLTRGTWIGSAEAIGWSKPKKARATANPTVVRLNANGTIDAVNDHVHAVLEQMAGQEDRVDYVDLRAGLGSLTAITRDQWDTLVEAAGTDLAPKTWRLRGVAAWLWHNHGLNPMKEFPGFSAHGNRETAVEYYRRFRIDDLPQIEPALPTWAATLDLHPGATGDGRRAPRRK